MTTFHTRDDRTGELRYQSFDQVADAYAFAAERGICAWCGDAIGEGRPHVVFVHTGSSNTYLTTTHVSHADDMRDRLLESSATIGSETYVERPPSRPGEEVEGFPGWKTSGFVPVDEQYRRGLVTEEERDAPHGETQGIVDAAESYGDDDGEPDEDDGISVFDSEDDIELRHALHEAPRFPSYRDDPPPTGHDV